MATRDLNRLGGRAVLALAAIGGAAAPALAQDSFHALGTEPFWDVTIERGRIDFDDASSEQRFAVRAPARVRTANGYGWRTPRIRVDVRHEACGDGMSMRLYPTEVRVRVGSGGRELQGCGGYTYRGNLSGTSWQIVNATFNEVGGEAYRIQFAGGRLTGRAGCNRFSGPYRMAASGRITIGPLAVTRMACPEPQMEIERAVLETFAEPAFVTYGRAGEIAIGNEVGGVLLRRIP